MKLDKHEYKNNKIIYKYKCTKEKESKHNKNKRKIQRLLAVFPFQRHRRRRRGYNISFPRLCLSELKMSCPTNKLSQQRLQLLCPCQCFIHNIFQFKSTYIAYLFRSLSSPVHPNKCKLKAYSFLKCTYI